MNERVLTSIQVILFASAIRSLGKHCFLPSLANRMIRMSKDEEMGKKK